MTQKEITVLLYFLKAGFSTRELDLKLGHVSKKSKGWISWEILKKYNVNDADKGKLFVFPTQQARSIIKELPLIDSNSPVDILLTLNKPNNLKRFHDSYLITESVESFYQIMKGETRNIIRDFFITKKKLVGKCQFKGCNVNTALETAHNLKSRPQIFKESATKFKKNISGKYMFDLASIFEDYLMSHKAKKSVCFLCKAHHREFDNPKKTKKEFLEFRKKIEW